MNDTRKMLVTMPDGSIWAIPVQAIIDHRLAYYQSNGKAEPADEAPDDFEIHDWAPNNMNWDDVKGQALLVHARAPMTAAEWQEGWCNGHMEIKE